MTTERLGFLRRAASKLGGFGTSIVISGLASLLAVPVIIRFGGSEEWAAVAVGQTVGALVGVFTGLGWSQTGPTEVAAALHNDRRRIYLQSVIWKLPTLLVTIPIAVVIASVLSSAHSTIAATAAVGGVLLHASASWFFIGSGAPAQLLAWDTAPRVMGILIGAGLVFFTGNAIGYVVSVLAGIALGILLSSFSIMRGYRHWKSWSMGLTGALRAQGPGLGIAVFSSIYLTLPLLVLASAQPAGISTYALADKMKQQAMAVVSPAAQTLQGWVPSSARRTCVDRVALAWRVSLLVGSLAGGLFVFGGPWASLVLGGGVITLQLAMTVPFGIAFGLNAVSLIVGAACLMPLGRKNDVFASAVIGTVMAVPLLLWLAPAYGGVGTAWAVAGAQASVVIYQFARLSRAIRDVSRP